MKKTVLFSMILCLSLFSFLPVFAGCGDNYGYNKCDCANANCFGNAYDNSQSCQCLNSGSGIIHRDGKTCYRTNSADGNYNYFYCGSLYSRCANNNCGCNYMARNTGGCFKSNYTDQNNNLYYCEESITANNCSNVRRENCSSHNMPANNADGKIFIKVENGGNVYINGNQIAKTEVQRNYLNLRARGQGVYTRDLKKIPIGIIHMFGEDSDKDGLPNDFEWSIGTDPYNFNTDRDRYSDKMEIIAWYNPNGAGKLSSDQKIINKMKGKFLLQVEHAGELWYVNPQDGKRYFIGNEYDAMELVKAFKL
jgi:hypothetical protein